MQKMILLLEQSFLRAIHKTRYASPDLFALILEFIKNNTLCMERKIIL